MTFTNKHKMGVATVTLSLSLLALFIQPSGDFLPQEAFAKEEHMMMTMIAETQRQDSVGLEFSVPETIVTGKLIPINARVFDLDNDANLSHTDWSYAVIDPNGNIVHKSTTLHGHYGIMNFKDSFPESGTYTIQYTVSSSGPFMLGKPVPELGQTRSVLTGDLLRFEEDPKNNFGSRTFEFTIQVVNAENSVTLPGSEFGTSIHVTLTTNPEKIIAGQPAMLILDVNDAETDEDATHVDALISLRRGYYHPSQSGDQPDAPVPIPLHGAYHGHLGAISLTQTFPQSGTYLLKADLNVVPYSAPLFGQASTTFRVQVFDPQGTEDSVIMKESKENSINIVGLASPFYTPNVITVPAGQEITFDNIDGNHHTVTSVRQGTTEVDGKFDSGLMAAGDKYQVTLDEQGTFEYYCALHTQMRGTIIVS